MNIMKEQEESDMTTDVVNMFNNTFEKGNLTDIFSQIGESALDQIIDNNVLRNIPIIGLIFSGYRTVVNIKEFYLARKVYRFLYNLKDTSPQERQKFSENYCESNRENTAIALLNILDQLNNENFVPIICNLMIAVINENISIAQFNRLIMSIQRTAYTDIIQLGKYCNEYDEEGLSDALLASGLIYQSTIDGGDAAGNCYNKFMVNANGVLLLEYGLRKQ